MLFNSNFFLYVFLPVLLLLFYLSVIGCKGRIKLGNIIILLFSTMFYICTGGWCILILLSVIIFNYTIGRIIGCCTSDKKSTKKCLLVLAVVGNIGILIYFKYSGFIYENFSLLMKMIDSQYVEKIFDVVLPVGISFFIFQALSYVIDVYKEDVEAQRNFLNFALYISMFPQLIAGPIVRYKTICKEIDNRVINIYGIYEGVYRFVIGLGKKVLVADLFGTAVDKIWALLPSGEITTPLAWSAAFLYTLQIYFDFSGYSDMAIGLGRMLGFHFEENFEQPYTSSNMGEFWKRWHISLSSFLRDYLYIPLGGNRGGTFKTYRNLIIVFLLCGLWHGSAWNFVVWGIYHGVFLVIERILKNKFNITMKGIGGRVVTFFIVMMGWIFFRASSINEAIEFYKVLFGGAISVGEQFFTYQYYIYFKIVVVAIGAFIASFFRFKKVSALLKNEKIKGIVLVLILFTSMAYMSDASFTPFIYFQF